MITCKEDLINTKVDGRDEEVCKLFQELAFSFGFTWCDFNDQTVRYPDDDYFVICCDKDEEVSWERESSTRHNSFTELTMYDLKPKPRTKVVYEKVTESINEIAKSMIDGEVFYNHDGSDKFDWKLNGFSKNGLALTGLNGFDFYRKVEKEIDWREEVHNKFQSSGCHWSTPIGEVINDESDCFLDLCRVALRATGGLE